MRDKEGSDVEMCNGDISGLIDGRGRYGANMYCNLAYNIRESFDNYFVSAKGSLPFQNNIINKGQLH